jgi:hypothetical protein
MCLRDHLVTCRDAATVVLQRAATHVSTARTDGVLLQRAQVSVSFCFICLLHLANEKSLAIVSRTCQCVRPCREKLIIFVTIFKSSVLWFDQMPSMLKKTARQAIQACTPRCRCKCLSCRQTRALASRMHMCVKSSHLCRNTHTHTHTHTYTPCMIHGVHG